MASILSTSQGISHPQGSEQGCADSCTNTALSSHSFLFKLAWICEPVTACFSCLHFVHIFFEFPSSPNLCFCIALLCHLCTEEDIAVWVRHAPRREEKPLSLSYSFPHVSVTLLLLLGCDALRPNCPWRPNTPRELCPGCLHSEPRKLSHLSQKGMSLNGWKHVSVLDEKGPMGRYSQDATHVNVMSYT